MRRLRGHRWLFRQRDKKDLWEKVLKRRVPWQMSKYGM